MTSELKRLGHDVEVVTALPNYPYGRFLPGYERSFYRRELEEGIDIQRLWLYPAMSAGFQRILNYGSFAITSLFGLLRAKKPDYIFVESPPLSLAVPGIIFARLSRVPVILNVADLWPDCGIEMGLVKSPATMRILQALERWSYREASFVTVLTEGAQKSLLREKGVRPEKILFLPNGVDTKRFQPWPANAALKEKLGLAGKKIILYPGTLGHAHGLDLVLHAAKILEPYPEIHFLLLGDGSDRAHLERLQKTLGLRNLTFHDPVTIEELPPYLSIAECGLASLRASPVFDGTRPAKMFPIFASGKPLIFVGQGEAARLVERVRAGIVVAPDDRQGFADAVRMLLGNSGLVNELGKNGRRFVEENFQWPKLIGDWLIQLMQAQAESSTGSLRVRRDTVFERRS